MLVSVLTHMGKPRTGVAMIDHKVDVKNLDGKEKEKKEKIRCLFHFLFHVCSLKQAIHIHIEKAQNKRFINCKFEEADWNPNILNA